MTKPGASWREEPWWHWDWPGRPGSYVSHGNGVGSLGGAPSETPPLAGKIIVPEAQSPTGWRDFWVYREAPPLPPARKMGY